MSSDSGQSAPSLKHIRKLEWLGIGLLFVGVISVQLFTERQLDFVMVGTDPYYHLLFTLNHFQPDLFQNDPVFSNPLIGERAFTAYPLFLGIAGFMFERLGFFNTLSILQPIISIVYLLTAFFFLYKFTDRPWISALIALLSARQTPIFPSEQWGVLSTALVIPGTVFQAVAPLIFWAWLHYQQQPGKLRWVYLILGFAGTLHPLSWYTMTASMLFAQVVAGRFQWPSIKTALQHGMISLIPLIPFLASGFFTPTLNTPSSTNYAMEQEALLTTLESLKLETLTRNWFSGFMATSGWIVIGVWSLFKVRSRVPNQVIYFGLGCILLFLGSYALNELVLLPNQKGMFMHGNRTLKYLMLPAMLIVAMWLSRFTGKALLVRATVTGLMIAVFNASVLYISLALAPFDIPGHLYLQWQAFTTPPRKEFLMARKNIVEAAQWVKAHTDPVTARIHVSSENKTLPFMIRALGERSITYAWADGAVLYNLNSPKLGTWYHISKTLDDLYKTQGPCTSTEIDFARQLKATHLICPATSPAEGLTAVHQAGVLKIYEL